MLKTLFLASLLMSSSAFASARLTLDETSGTLIINTHLHFYGGEAGPEIAEAISNEISSMWNRLHGETYQFPQGRYRVHFQIDYDVISTEEAYQRIPREKDCKNNYVRVENTTGIMTEQTRSSWIGPNPFIKREFGNTGFFNLRDDLGNSTTAAHEYGHALGLDHSPSPVIGQPPIMAARGTWVDSVFQVIPEAVQGTPGGTVDVHKRLVIKADIEEILENVVDITLVGKPLLHDPRLLGKPLDPSCLGSPTNIAFDEHGITFKLPYNGGDNVVRSSISL